MTQTHSQGSQSISRNHLVTPASSPALPRAERENGAAYLGFEALKARGGQVPLHLGKLEYVHPVLPETPLAHSAVLQYPLRPAVKVKTERIAPGFMTRPFRATQPRYPRTDAASRNTTRRRTTRSRMAALDSRAGEMHIADAFLRRVGHALPQHPLDTSIPNTSLEGDATRRP